MRSLRTSQSYTTITADLSLVDKYHISPRRKDAGVWPAHYTMNFTNSCTFIEQQRKALNRSVIPERKYFYPWNVEKFKDKARKWAMPGEASGKGQIDLRLNAPTSTVIRKALSSIMPWTPIKVLGIYCWILSTTRYVKCFQELSTDRVLSTSWKPIHGELTSDSVPEVVDDDEGILTSADEAASVTLPYIWIKWQQAWSST